jgi:hypothetical protein
MAMNNRKERRKHGLEARRPVRAGLYDMVFALNLAFSFVYALLVGVFKRMGSPRPDDLCYFFLRAAARINHALLLSPVSPVSTSDMERHMPGFREQVGRELVLLVSVFAATTIVYFLLRMIAGTRFHRRIHTRLLGPSLLFAAPLSYLAVMHNVSGEAPYYAVPSFWGVSYRSLVLVLEAEGVAAMVVALATPMRSVPRWLFGALWLMHFGFWIPVLWSALLPWEGASLVGFFVPHALLIGWFLVAAIWALRLRRGEPSMLWAGAPGMAWTLLAGATAAGVSAFIWLPHLVRSVADPSHRDSVTVELSRGPCLGLCPTYSVRVHGNGSVEYTGAGHVRERGKATATLSADQVTTILEKLDSVGFFGIEDSAFAWAFDTAGIAVVVSVDGITHRVSSDQAATGPKSGTQARFVQVANEIDQIIGSRRWVE